MHKLSAAFKKEVLILFRDIPGLIILFIMPLVLVMIVTVAQQNAEKHSGRMKTDLLFVDNSNSAASKELLNDLSNSGLFIVIDSNSNRLLNEKETARFIAEGKYEAGIVIGEKDSVILILVDPALQESFRKPLVASITYFIRSSQSKVSIENLLKLMAPGMEETTGKMIKSVVSNLAPVREVYPTREKSTLKPTMAQNSIPGFILFAMFFIVIPLSGSLISEKSSGSFLRLKTLPVRIRVTLTAKVIIYLIVSLLQFILMLGAGIWILPAMFGLPAFELGNQYPAILLITLSSSLAAIGFGLFVGSYATTHGQAALFGSVVVVILAVISGSFLPIYMFPEAIRILSQISPIRWGIDAYLEIFIRGGTIINALPEIFLLLLFFGFAMISSVHIFAKQKQVSVFQ